MRSLLRKHGLAEWRVLAVLSFEGAIPYAWRECVQRAVYGWLDGSAAGADAHRSKYSLFTFDLQPRKPEFLEEGWRSRDGIWLFRFASARPEVSALVLAALAGAKRIDLGCGAFEAREVYKEPLSDRPVFRVSPVLAAKLKERGFWTPSEPEFDGAVARSLANRWEFWTGRKADGIRFRFLGEPVRKLVRFRGRNLLAFAGDARLDASRELRLFAQLVGLGQKPSCGFGYPA